jgi:serine/threonine protein kinase
MVIQILQPGDKIKNDRFHILKQLGFGGFGITYLVEETLDEDKKKTRQVVIKTLNANQHRQSQHPYSRPPKFSYTYYRSWINCIGSKCLFCKG